MTLQYIDPRVKLFLLLCLSTAALVLQMPAALASLFVLTLLILLLGGIKPGVIWLKLRGLFRLVIMLFILQCIFNRSGEPLLTLRGLTLVTDAGFRVAVMVSLRLLVVIQSALVVAVGDTRDYLLALTTLRVPYEIAFMVLAALRFLPMLREEAQDVLCAAQMRGLRIKKTGLKGRAAAYLSIVLPVVAGAIRRAEQLSIAMEARGFRAYPRRTSMRTLHMRRSDWVYAAVFLAVMSAIFVFFFTL